MITPNDIETKVFSSSLRGYNKREVDEFLDQIMIDYQALLDQNAKMLERVHVLQKQVAEAKDPARMTKDAKRLMNDISASAEQKAEVIIKNAKHDAENIVRSAKDSTSQADEDAERLRRKVEKFKLRFKQMLEEEIDKIDDNSEDLLDDLREDFYPTNLYGGNAGDMTKVAGGAVEAEDPIADLPDVEPTGDIDEEGAPDGVVPDEAYDEVVPDEAYDEVVPDEAVSDDDQNLGEQEDAISDDTVALGSVEEPEAAEEAEQEAAEEEAEAVATEEEEELEAAEEAPEEEVAELELEPAEEPEEESEGGGAPAETVIIDKTALAKAFKEQEQEDTMTEDELEKFIEYDDPDRTEPVEEPEPLTEEEQAAKYADYAGGGVTDKTIVITDKIKEK